MIHTIRLLVFDLDGTLIDSRLDLIHSVNATLRHFGRPELRGDVIASYVGEAHPRWCGVPCGAADDGADEMSEVLFPSALAYFLGYYRLHKLDHTTVYEGIPEVLAALAQPLPNSSQWRAAADGGAVEQARKSIARYCASTGAGRLLRPRLWRQ